MKQNTSDWKQLAIYNDLQLESFIRNNDYRTIIRNGKQLKRCDLCEETDDRHMIEYNYRSCSSVKCNSH